VIWKNKPRRVICRKIQIGCTSRRQRVPIDSIEWKCSQPNDPQVIDLGSKGIRALWRWILTNNWKRTFWPKQRETAANLELILNVERRGIPRAAFCALSAKPGSCACAGGRPSSAISKLARMIDDAYRPRLTCWSQKTRPCCWSSVRPSLITCWTAGRA